MRDRRYVPSSVVLASALLAAMFLIACNASNQGVPKEAAVASPPATATKVFVVFEGPWAFVPDPSDAAKVLALAPKTKIHRDLYVAASNNSTLASGVYDLSVPVSGGVGAATPDANIVVAKTTPSDRQRVLNTKLERYAIRLPKPEAFVTASRYRSRVGPNYPPDASTEKDYATAVSLRYSVSSLNGFSLAGTPDTGSFNPLLLQVDTPTVHFTIDPDPAHEDDPADKCRPHSRESFHDLTKLLNVTLYVDFPDSPSNCRDKDPQRPKTAQGIRPSLVESMAALLGGNLLPVASAGSETRVDYQGLVDWKQGASMVTRYLMTAVYLFGHNPVACRAPIIIDPGP